MSKLKAIRLAAIAAIAGFAIVTILVRDRGVGEPPIDPEEAHASLDEHVEAQADHAAQGAEEPKKTDDSGVYLPGAGLHPQLPHLTRSAGKGSDYSACVLATALHLCRRRSDALVDLGYSDAYLTGLSEEQAESFATSISHYEYEVSRMCADIDPADSPNSLRWLVKAAIAGHPASMSRLVSLNASAHDTSEPPDKDIVAAFRSNAERALNRAAEAGEIRAIEQISAAYAMGEITSALGAVSIRPDDFKALAASQASAMIRDESKKRKIPFDDFDDRELRATIRSRMAQMRREELARFSHFVSTYYGAYWNKHDQARDTIGPMSELPEHSCEALRRR